MRGIQYTEKTTTDPSSHIKSTCRVSTHNAVPLCTVRETVRIKNKSSNNGHRSAAFRYRPLQLSSTLSGIGWNAYQSIYVVKALVALTDGRRRELLTHQPFQFSGSDHNVGQVDGAGIVDRQREGNLIVRGRLSVAIPVGGRRIAAFQGKGNSMLGGQVHRGVVGKSALVARRIEDFSVEVDLDLPS